MVKLKDGGTEGSMDLLADVLASIEGKTQIKPRAIGDWPVVRLISFKSFNLSHLSQLRLFQKHLKEIFGVNFVVIGGGYGCSKVVFSIKARSHQAARDFVLGTMRSDEFRALGVEAEFKIAILDEPYIRVDLSSGNEQISSKAKAAIVNNVYINEVHLMTKNKTMTKIKGGVKNSNIAIESDKNIQLSSPILEGGELLRLLKSMQTSIDNDTSLDDNDKNEAKELVEAVTDEVQKEEPKLSLLKSYSGSLKSIESIGSSLSKLGSLLGLSG